MNNEMVRFTVDFAIHDGKLGEFERIAEALAGFGAEVFRHWHGLSR